MYPGHYNLEWLKFKDGTPLVPPRKRGSVARAWQWRERGINPRGQPPNKTVLENIAEDILVQKPLQITSCDLPGFPRSTFLMVFSPDGTKLASTHGNHYIYVSELASGKHVTILKGHPRTPWCIAFHPSHPQLIGSGCLGGQVRVWDIASGGSEVWNVCNETVIASIAFHPREQLLVIATFNELYFWDWSQPAPFTKVSTKNINEKVRYVAFDSLGFKLITGISLWACPANMNSNPLATSQTIPPASGNNSNPGNGSPGNNGNNGNGPGNGGPGNGSNNPRGDGPPRGDDDAPGRPHTPAAAQDMIVNSYQTLVQRYDSLVRNYQRLFMVRHRLINTPPLANTIDRGTDPMEPYPLVSDRHRRRSARLPRADPDNLSINFEPGTSQQQDSSESSSSPTPTPTPRPEFSTMMDSSPSDSASTRNSPGMGVLGFRVPIPGLRHIGFASAFQPPGDERTTRLLPNPFSSTNSNIQPNTSRTSGLFMPRDTSSDPLGRFSVEMRNAASAENVQIPGSAATNSGLTGRNADSLRAVFERAPPLSLLSTGPPYVPPAAPQSGPPYVPPAAPQSGPPYVPPAAPQSGPPYVATAAPPPLPTGPPPATPPPPAGPAPDAATATSETPTTQTSTYTQNSTRSPDPLDPYRDAHSINESLDLIRDILRDSGTRLLNLITNMSLNILTNSEREDGARVPVQVFTGNLRRDFMASSSDSEGEHPEVNITRTPNATFQEGDNDSIEMEDLSRTRADDSPQSNSSELIETVTNRMTIEIESLSETPSRRGGINVSDRMTFELDQASEVPSREGGINVSLSDDRFRVRTQGTRSVKSNPELTRDETPPPVPIATNNDSELDSSSESSRDSSLLSSPNPSVPSPNASVPSPNPSARDEPQPGPSSAPDGLDPSQPSTSRGHGRHRGNDIPAQAFRRFRMGVTALQKHTLQLANMWLRGDRTTLRELRAMWEDLRRRILALPTFYNRSLLERCMLLSEFTVMPDLPTRQHGRFRRNTRMGDQNSARNRNRPTRARSEESSRSIQLNQYNALNGAGPSTSTASASNPHTVGTTNSSNPSTSSSSNATAGPSSSNATAGPSTSNTNDSRSSRAAANRAQRRRLVRLQQSYLWRGESENRRRDRNLPTFRISQPRRTRNSIMRTVEQNATRHVIRTRAMKILSVMFNMMMMCLEERGLSQLIINMLKTLKKALALTCFMMMSNRNISNIIPPASQSIESADVVRIQNVDHSEPINVDDNIDDPHSLRVIRYDAIADDPRLQAAMRPPPAASSSTQTEDISPVEPLPSPMTNATSQSWSHRLAVQIAAANRNTSSTAKTRKDMYQETRRQKALHRTNPTAHPYIRRRVAPVMSHRIPALRSLPPGRFHPRVTARSPPPEPVPGPSNELPGNRNPENLWQIGRDARENFIRLAHIRLRTAARNRFRRLQTIRLYTPSSVREMFALQDFQGENRTEEAAPPEELENQYGPRRPQFHAMFASEGLLQVNDLPPAAEANANPRLPRIHEYLQPIILAQNAMVVDDEDGGGGGGPPAGLHGNRRIGGMAGLLDAGVISEALPAPSHRVQAWDFTSGAAPDIADSTKNVVVSRCRIHNDASIDISKDGKLLVALLPVPRLRNANWLGEYHVGVYSLDWPRLGQCLHTAVLEQSAVSVALSPTARYLAVGLGSRRFTSSHSRTNIIALLYKLDPLETTGHTGLSPMKELEQYWEHGFTSLNCLRWAPQPGQGLVYANNTGQLIIMS